jgi:hypothetical protein
VSVATAPLDRLRALDRRVRAELPSWKTLEPGRSEARALVDIAERAAETPLPHEVFDAFARALEGVVVAQVASFPGNLFWDFDLPAERLLRLAAQEPEAAALRLERATSRFSALQRAFGAESKIQFRYAHDFIYGFDWARWVQREPDRRGSVGPFDDEFIDHMQRRAGEIVVLVEQHDAKYPPLPPGVARNPFGFSREPRDEERLHRDLAERRLVPVEAWNPEAEPRWDLPFSALREERARQLGIWR